MNYQVAIIGGGPAGYTAAETAAKAGMSVVLFEKKQLGGVCLNEGCIPTKTLLYAAKVLESAKNAAKYGILVSDASADLSRLLNRKVKVVRKLALGIKARLDQAGVNVVNGEAYIENAHTIRCDGEIFGCDYLIVCTGSKTVIPAIDGLESIDYWTHREALDCKELPQSLAVIGGGVIGMEFAAYFSSLGVRVSVLEMADEILSGTDKEIAAMLRTVYEKKGITFLLGRQVTKTERTPDGIRVSFCVEGEDIEQITADKVLLSVGRRPVSEGFGLENLSLSKSEKGHILTDSYMQSSLAGVYICGDLNGKSLLAHTAVAEAETAVAHITGNLRPMRYDAIPAVVYTNPEVASAGATEESLNAAGVPHHVLRLPMTYSGRFVAENEGVNGLIKLITDEDDVVLSMHIIGNPASELIAFGNMLITDGAKSDALSKYIFPHPTVGEILRDL